MGQLASGLAHELGTRLNVVIGRARITVDSQPGAGTRFTLRLPR